MADGHYMDDKGEMPPVKTRAVCKYLIVFVLVSCAVFLIFKLSDMYRVSVLRSNSEHTWTPWTDIEPAPVIQKRTCSDSECGYVQSRGIGSVQWPYGCLSNKTHVAGAWRGIGWRDYSARYCRNCNLLLEWVKSNELRAYGHTAAIPVESK